MYMHSKFKSILSSTERQDSETEWKIHYLGCYVSSHGMNPDGIRGDMKNSIDPGSTQPTS